MPACRALGFALVAVLALAQYGLADKTVYVSDRLQVIVRVSPNLEAKTIDHVATGEVVSVLETTGDGWVKIRANDGKEGWALARYFVDEPPAAVRLKDLDPQSKNLAQKLEEARKEALDAKAKLAQADSRAQQAEASYQKLRTDSADVIRLREDCQKLNQDFQQQGQKLEELATENEALRFGTNLKWFLAGGGVLLIGWLMGLAFGRRKRRWSSGLD